MPAIEEKPEYGDIIERRREKLGWSRADLEERSGVAARAIRAYEREGQEPSASRWEAIRDAFAEAGEGSQVPDRQPAKMPRKIEVRHFGRVGAGPGRQLGDYETVTLSRKEYVSRFGGRDPDAVGLWECDGDSAAPVFFDGEDIAVEVIGGTQEFKSEQIYVFRRGRDAMVKRLRRMEDDTVWGQSLNPSIADIKVDPSTEDFEVLGRVIDTAKQQLYTSLVGRFMRTEDL